MEKHEKETLIKGKWYEVIQDGFIKVDFVKIGSHKIPVSETTNTAISERVFNKILEISNYSICTRFIGKEANLSEIQQFLPEGHIDKIVKVPERSPYNCDNTAILTTSNTFYNKNAAMMGYNKEPRARLATEDEKKWLDVCIQKGAFVTKEEALKPSKIEPIAGEMYVIHIKNNPSYDSIFTSKGGMENADRLYLNSKGGFSINEDSHWSPDGEYEFRNATQEEKDWLKACHKAGKFVPKTMEIPEYVECVNSWHSSWTTGKVYKTEKKQRDFPKELSLKNDNGGISNVCSWDVLPSGFKPSTKEAYEQQNKPKEPELIEGQWYFVKCAYDFLFKCRKGANRTDGSKYIDIKYNNSYVQNNYMCFDSDIKELRAATIGEMEIIYKYFPEERPKEKVMENWCVQLTDENKNTLLHYMNNVVYMDILKCKGGLSGTSKYYGVKNGSVKAENSSFEKLLTTEEFYKKIGHVTEKPMNTYGLKVGDVLDSNITYAYLKIKGNFWPGSGHGWNHSVDFGGYGNTRTIESFKEIDGIMAFKVSGCSIDSHYLKAEGFKEFVDNFNNPKEEFPVNIGDKFTYSSGSTIWEISSMNTTHLTVKDEKTGKTVEYSIKCFIDLMNKPGCFKRVNKPKTTELSSLPENWCIKVKSCKQDTEILKWRMEKSNHRQEWYHDKGYLSEVGYFTHDKPNCTEITFEQFKKWVLKPEVMEDLTGRWLKALDSHPQAIGDMSKGDFGLISSMNKDMNGGKLNVLNKGSNWEWSKSYITKGIFELMPIGWSPEHIFTPEKETFKEGDWVILTGTGNLVNVCNFTIGKAYKLGGKYFNPSPGQDCSTKMFYVEGRDDGNPGGCCTWTYRKARPDEIPTNTTYIKYPLTPKGAYFVGHDPYKEELSITDVFKPKKSVKMSYFTEITQQPRTLSKINKQKSITI